jgi:protein-disulfide isomerase
MATESNQSFIERNLMAIGLFLGLCLVALALYYGHGSSPATTGTTGQQQGTGATQAVDIQKVKTDGEPFIGNPNAPVAMAIWFDYQCPFCKQFDQGPLSQVYQNYVQTGKVKVIFKDFPFLGDDSIAAGEFGRAVWALYPNQFYNWYMAMFAAQDAEGDQGFGDQASIVAMTKTQVPQIDTAKVVSYVNANKAKLDAELQADKNEGIAFGIQGTPSVIVGTQLLAGAQPYTTVSAALDAALKAKGQ